MHAVYFPDLSVRMRTSCLLSCKSRASQLFGKVRPFSVPFSFKYSDISMEPHRSSMKSQSTPISTRKRL